MSNAIEINELHWLLAVTQNIDVGIVVLDLNYRVIYDVTDVAANRNQLQAANDKLQQLSGAEQK